MRSLVINRRHECYTMASFALCLEKYRIKDVPATVYYIPEFISEKEEADLIQQVYGAPIPKWTQLSNRRLQNWGGLPHPKGMISEKLPKWLDKYGHQIAELGVFEDRIPNHVLVNEYVPGQGIMPHEDGPLYYPTVSNITLGSHTVIHFYRPLTTDDSLDRHPGDITQKHKSTYEQRHFASLLLERRSLLLLRDEMYTFYLHGIDEETSDTISEKVMNIADSRVNVGDVLERTTRISLTIRHVPKVLKTKIFLGRRIH